MQTKIDWPNDDMLIEFARETTPAQRLEWLEAALDFAHAAGALKKMRRLDEQDAARTRNVR
jgi:hypothetical protein